MSFPTNPSNGEIYNNKYIYDSSINAWNKRTFEYSNIVKDKISVDLSSLDIGTYYPFEITSSYDEIEFFLKGHRSGSGNEPYNLNQLRFWGMTYGWTDTIPMWDFQYNRYGSDPSTENLIWGVYRGTSAFWGIVVYLRGGVVYSMNKNDCRTQIHSESVSIGHSGYPDSLSYFPTFAPGETPSVSHAGLVGSSFYDNQSYIYS